MNGSRHVLVMYDVRGIQEYIFRTAKLRDAIGASAIVEDIVEDALKDAGGLGNRMQLQWYDEKNGPLDYRENEADDIQVLYIGGGNAFVVFSSRELAVRVNKRMAKYVIDKTYSLQLATAIVDKTDNYQKDFRNIRLEMDRIKENMVVSKPIGAMPVMQVEKKTGYPLTKEWKDRGKETVSSTEAKLKAEAGIEKRKLEEKGSAYSRLEKYISEKGRDSMLAVVHIDGNNMGLRIREQTESLDTYEEAVSKMREISYNINHSYKEVFEEMENDFNTFAKKPKGKENNYFVMKVLTAGDDITYVCNASIAVATVEYFSRHISEKGMVKASNDNFQYRFSVCGGIAFFRSHFPFDIAYEVAEACCESAKRRAKDPANMDGNLIGNWFDFQFCQNVQSMNLERIRQKEYKTAGGESLQLRPYFISVEEMHSGFDKVKEKPYTLEKLKEYVGALVDGNKMPRSFAKRLRNTYPLGRSEAEAFDAFLKSRGTMLPEVLYTKADGEECATFYDAAEIMDYFLTLDEMKKGER